MTAFRLSLAAAAGGHSSMYEGLTPCGSCLEHPLPPFPPTHTHTHIQPLQHVIATNDSLWSNKFRAVFPGWDASTLPPGSRCWATNYRRAHTASCQVSSTAMHQALPSGGGSAPSLANFSKQRVT
jgi:hypothetical protein